MSEMPWKVLSTLLVSGAQSPERALSSHDLARQLGIEGVQLQSEIEALERRGYILFVVHNDVRRLYLTLTGIIAASSVYS